MSNVENFDILAIHRKTYKQYAIQVKTTCRKSKKWILTKKNEDLVGDNIFYIFVSLNELALFCLYLRNFRTNQRRRSPELLQIYSALP